jgi:hypothetical protein
VDERLVTEVTFPACDASASNPQTMTVKITPEVVRAGALSGAAGGATMMPAPQWRSSNFALQIAGCEQSCKYATAIDALTVKFPMATNAIGTVREYVKTPSGALQVPDLTVYMSQQNDTQFAQWQQTFEIMGQSTAANEKTGTLHYLAPDLKTSLFTLNFGGLGIYRLSSDATAGGIRRAKAQMYCDTIGFVVG